MARTAISAPLRANPRRCYSWSPCIALLAEDATDTDTKLSSFAALLTDGWVIDGRGGLSGPAQGENGQGDQGPGLAKLEGHAGDESDFGVDRFDEAVGRAILDGGEDLCTVADDATLQHDERFDAAASGQPTHLYSASAA